MYRKPDRFYKSISTFIVCRPFNILKTYSTIGQSIPTCTAIISNVILQG